MNWIEIDKVLYGILSRHTSIQDVYAEAQKQFKWDLGQAQAAIDPLAKRSKFINESVEAVAKTTQKRKTVTKKRQTTRNSK